GNASSSSSSSSSGSVSPLSGWTRRRPVIIQPLTEQLDNYMLLVSVTQDAQIGMDAKLDGDDLVFTDSDGATVLPHEMEFYNVVNGAADFVAWVRVPQIPMAGKTIYLYWGKPNIGPQQDAGKTWQDFVAVYHLQTNFNDSTINAHHGTVLAPSGPSPSTEPGVIANGKRFPGGSLAEVASSPDFDCANTPCTITAWINSSTLQTSHVVDRYVSGVPSSGWYIGTTDTMSEFGFAGDSPLFMNNPAATDAWYHVAAVVSQAVGKFYINGVLEETDTTFSGIVDATSPLYLGTGSPSTYFFHGKLDEVRIAHTTRSDAWIKAEYRNAKLPDQFVTLGPVEMF
ncbi:MAG TPA: DUF2341 domain-containing protein, partial [Polyangium sp.]|nr:DUF2341 domain-containing protein [Polyangium sp.]